MEGVVILLLIAILIILVRQTNSFNEKLYFLRNEIIQLKELLSEIPLKKPIPGETPAVKKIEVPVKPILKPAQEGYWETGFKIAEQNNEVKIPKQPEHWQPVEQMASDTCRPVLEKEPTSFSNSTNHPPKKPIATIKPGFFERNPDLEKFIGENLVNKIGIGILVLAIGYFVKFAIDNNWIGEWGRVAVGLVCGGILIGLGFKLRGGYKAFSSVLIGGGLAVFYFTIALAYHQFNLFSQSVAFIIMMVITILAVALSLIYDRQEVAIIALVGGFCSPFMVSNESGNYKTLFTYLILLNIGLLVLACKKGWRLLNLLAFLFTLVIVGGWLYTISFNEPVITYKNAFAFITIFYLLFFAINIAHNIKENKQFISSDFGILLANTSLYFTAGLYCLYNMQASEYKGMFSASMGVFNLGLSYLFFRKQKVDPNILYLLIGITLTFVSLTAPL